MKNNETNDSGVARLVREALAEKRYAIYIFLAAGAFLTGLTLICPAVGALEWVTLVPPLAGLLWLCEGGTRGKRLYGYGFFFFFCFYLVGFKWFTELYPMDFIDGFSPLDAVCVVAAAWLGLSAFQAAFGGLLFLAVGLIGRGTLCQRYPLLRVFFTAGLWAVYEWTQTLGWFGVPWARLPLGQVDLLVGLQTASLFGSYFVTFSIVLVNASLAYILLNGEKKRFLAACAALTVIFQYGVGSVLYLSHRESKGSVDIAAIQGNIPSDEKWDGNNDLKTLENYRDLTLYASAAGADIVVFPETALPYRMSEGSFILDFTRELAQRSGVIILVGAFDSGEDGELYNSVFCFLPDGTRLDTVYDKRHLVPFGEYVPMKRLVEMVIPPLAELIKSEGEVSPGEDSEVFFIDGVGKIGSLVCFDSIYEALVRDSVLDGAELLCISTNDSWFTDSEALYMHNAQAQLRAIETGRYVVRAANTGISSVITDKGKIIGSLAPYEKGYIMETVPLYDSQTLYSYTGDLFVYLIITVDLAVVFYNAYTERKTKIKNKS